jgi:hypothetical protein
MFPEYFSLFQEAHDMSQMNGSMVQKKAESEMGVTVEQEKAIVLMGSGKSVTEAAAEAGVGRRTLYRWLKEDPKFIAAWNAWRREIGQSARARLLGVAAEAVEAVREAVRKGDGRLALALLKGMGMVSTEAVGSEDAEVLAREMALAKKKEEGDLSEREMMAAIDGCPDLRRIARHADKPLPGELEGTGDPYGERESEERNRRGK